MHWNGNTKGSREMPLEGVALVSFLLLKRGAIMNLSEKAS